MLDAAEWGEIGVIKFINKNIIPILNWEQDLIEIACRKGWVSILKYVYQEAVKMNGEERMDPKLLGYTPSLFQNYLADCARYKKLNCFMYLYDQGFRPGQEAAYWAILGCGDWDSGRWDIILFIIENGLDLHDQLARAGRYLAFQAGCWGPGSPGYNWFKEKGRIPNGDSSDHNLPTQIQAALVARFGIPPKVEETNVSISFDDDSISDVEMELDDVMIESTN